jgi:hypothetical protein
LNDGNGSEIGKNNIGANPTPLASQYTDLTSIEGPANAFGYYKGTYIDKDTKEARTKWIHKNNIYNNKNAIATDKELQAGKGLKTDVSTGLTEVQMYNNHGYYKVDEAKTEKLGAVNLVKRSDGLYYAIPTSTEKIGNYYDFKKGV